MAALTVNRAVAFVRRHAPGAVLLAVTAVLRLPGLGSVPTPAGDEGNWPLYGLRMLHGEPVALAPAARFVTLLFARLIAVAFWLSGPGFAAARGVLVAGVLAGVAGVWALGRRSVGATGAAVMAGVLAVHPWSVFWSRTASVPYALDLALGTAGTLAVLAALETSSTVGLIVGAQLLGVGVQCSPLAVLPAVALAGWVLRPGVTPRVPWRAVGVAAVLAGLHGMPVAVGARVARAANGLTPHAASTVPLVTRWGCLARMAVGALSGEATAAHFGGRSPWAECVGAVLVLAVTAVCLRAVHRDRGVGGYAQWHLAVALAGLPLLLLPGRDWEMPTIDAERYGFALVVPFALLVGAAAARSRTARWAAWVYLAWLLVVPTGRTGVHFMVGGGGDQGLYTLLGGGRYRGWQVARGPGSLPARLRETVLADAHGEPATLAYDDYAFHPVRFLNAVAGDGRVDHALGQRVFPHGRRVYTVVWSHGAFDPGYNPVWVVQASQETLDRVHAMDPAAHRVRTFVQPDGSPLCEVWVGRAP